MTEPLKFLTGNAGKFAEAIDIIPSLVQVPLDLPEIQALDTRKVLEAKIENAISRGYRNVIVEDTSLHFDGLNGLPGPLIKWFLEALGVAGLYDFARKQEIATVKAICLLAYAKQPGEIAYFEGIIPGTLVPPRGTHGFGWDGIFLPQGQSKTFGEMSDREKGSISHRRLAFDGLKAHLKAAA